jgi:hypothetical protein
MVDITSSWAGPGGGGHASSCSIGKTGPAPDTRVRVGTRGDDEAEDKAVSSGREWRGTADWHHCVGSWWRFTGLDGDQARQRRIGGVILGGLLRFSVDLHGGGRWRVAAHSGSGIRAVVERQVDQDSWPAPRGAGLDDRRILRVDGVVRRFRVGVDARTPVRVVERRHLDTDARTWTSGRPAGVRPQYRLQFTHVLPRCGGPVCSFPPWPQHEGSRRVGRSIRQQAPWSRHAPSRRGVERSQLDRPGHPRRPPFGSTLGRLVSQRQLV